MGVSFSLVLCCDYSLASTDTDLIAFTFVGVPPYSADAIGTLAKFTNPYSVTISPSGAFAVVTDTGNNLIRLIDLSTSAVTTLAGQGTSSGSTNGAGTNSQFNSPYDSAISSDASFALIVDRGSHLIRKIIISTAEVTTLAGAASTSGSTDGIGTNSFFNTPSSISISPGDAFALVADTSNHRIRKVILSTAEVTTVAGSSSGYVDGTGTNSRFSSPGGIKISADGVFGLVADTVNHRIRIIDLSTSSVTTLAGSSFAFADGTGTNSQFYSPAKVAISPDNLFAIIADTTNHRIRLITISTAAVTTLAGSTAGSVNGIGTNARFSSPAGVDLFQDANGVVSVFVADRSNSLIRQIYLSTAATTTFAGIGGVIGSDDGIGTVSRFNNPNGIDISPDGVYALVADSTSNLIRKVVISTRSVSTLAGSSSSGNTDGIGTNSKFNFPVDVSISPNGLFALVVDFANNRIRFIDISSASVTTLAGSSIGNANGIGTNVKFSLPVGVDIAPNGDFALVTESFGIMIRRLEISTATVTPLAGSGVSGSANGIGTNSQFKEPYGICISPDGLFALVVDKSGYQIRHIDLLTAAVTTLAGSGSTGSQDGVGTSSLFLTVYTIGVSPDGLFALVPDYGNHRIRRIIISTASVSTALGSSSGYQNGIGTNALLQNPHGIAIDPTGLFALVTERGIAHGIRILTNISPIESSASPTSEPSLSPSSLPTSVPTLEPTTSPTVPPSGSPSSEPTLCPSLAPSALPSLAPTPSLPTISPTSSPTLSPTFAPTSPLYSPSAAPTRVLNLFFRPTLRPILFRPTTTTPAPSSKRAGWSLHSDSLGHDRIGQPTARTLSMDEDSPEHSQKDRR
jgi:DNA-binding beta-propeller fold protein YncE